MVKLLPFFLNLLGVVTSNVTSAREDLVEDLVERLGGCSGFPLFALRFLEVIMVAVNGCCKINATCNRYKLSPFPEFKPEILRNTYVLLGPLLLSDAKDPGPAIFEVWATLSEVHRD